MPDDLANLCSLFVRRRGQSIRRDDLLRRLRDGLRIDAGTHPEEIVVEGALCGLIEEGSDRYQITSVGMAVGKAQGDARTTIRRNAQEALLRRVYLNQATGDRCCGRFMREWEVDVDKGTFALPRRAQESNETLGWLQTLERVGLISVSVDRALVNPEYLGAVNELLAQERGVAPAPDSAAEKLRQAVGDVGEHLALEYEENRLRASGLDWLTPAVKHISPIDSTAGYDIASCQGTGKTPDRPIYIEVKATTASNVQFFWSYNERCVARDKGASYWIYVYTNVDLGLRRAKGPTRIRNPYRAVGSPRFDVEARDVFVRRV